MKNKYSIIRFLCNITNIILAIFFFIGNKESKSLPYFIFIIVLINLILSYKENKTSKKYTKYDGMKRGLSSLMIFWIVIIVFMIFGIIFRK
ncbi:hypothetical protein LGK97_17545 [Clostridium sp. CS001]|uniref:hypothetical protein n=1 Tax=Clostridium sp. CS001 TaxID=2880648 RepID=UPI001CF4FD6C|nr:hypothetical protein [Clostridium sp. CS001]MCB2291529.1 hypothetical protein [Clostridium sp. CS001]